ncbi:replication-relaxation family protein [Streptomyces monticola]|uniref:Replication-relaxation family protein n=1 Tax=Streptomyces monticola TaxID=2666263 RepID=A0ABW2JKY8_9ACTN
MPTLPRAHPTPGSPYSSRTVLTRRRTSTPSRHADAASLTRRLTPRDLWLIAMLHEHRVLTTDHISMLAFSSLRSAQRRLRTLHDLGILDSFRPQRLTGSAPEHYTLGRAGAAVLAAQGACELAGTGWRPDATARIAYSPFLGHTVGTNTLMARLSARARTSPGDVLTLWLSERSCARRWGDLVRPDAYGNWTAPSDAGGDDLLLPFFLEYDTGSYQLARLEAKLDGYAAFATTTGASPVLLIHTRTQSRDLAVRRRLAEPVRGLSMRVATSSADFTTATPWDRWWTPIAPGARRTTLTGLAELWTAATAPTDLEPTDTDTVLTIPVPPLPPPLPQ